LKSTRPEDDPEGFQALREAYEFALRMAQQHQDVELAEEGVADQSPEPERASVPRTAPASVMDAGPEAAAPAAAPPGAMEQARQLWREVEPTLLMQPRHRLSKVTSSEAMLNLEVRECFELCAAAYCASDTPSDEVREAVAGFFGWDRDFSFVIRHLPGQAHVLAARLRAQESYKHFCELASQDPAIAALLRPTAGRGLASTLARSFTRQMQRLVATIRLHHPEMLRYKLDEQVFATWERRVAGRRYFVDTALCSLLAGGLLWMAIGLLFPAVTVMQDNIGMVFVIVESVVCALVAWLTIRPPQAMQALAGAIPLRFVLYDLRMRPAAQFGWLVPFTIASLCMFLPVSNTFSQVALSAVMLASLAAATFANSIALRPIGYLLVFVLGPCAGIGMMSEPFAAGGVIALAAATTCIVQLLFRGGESLLDWLGVREHWYMPLRFAWLAGMAALISLSLAPLPLNLYAALVWLWLLGGILLSRASFNFYFAYLGAGIIHGVLLSVLHKPVLLATAPMPALDISLIAVSLFMAMNMKRAMENPNQFA
jgi:hypothetical protein